MVNKTNSDRELEQALDHHQKQTKDVNRILWIVLPILALLLSMIFANWNIWSLIGTFIALTLAFIAVGIKRSSLALTFVGIILYCLVDNYLSYKFQFSIDGLRRQLLCMVLFTAIISLMRPMLDRALTNYKKNQLK